MKQDIEAEKAMWASLDCVIDIVKQGWTQHTFARNAKDEPVSYDADDAVKWCLVAAYARCHRDEAEAIYTELSQGFFYNAFQEEFQYSPVQFNDYEAKTADDVITALERLKKRAPAFS